MKRLFLAGVMGILSLVSTQAQLAITEVMTGEADKNHPDWWELKNFGTNDIDLTGYQWNDDSHGGFSAGDSAPFTGVTIHAGETICVTEIKGVVTDADTFRTWWGLSSGIQVVVLNSADPGLGDTGDSVRIWSTTLAALGSNTNGLDLEQCPEYLVHRLETGDVQTPGKDGSSLTYNSVNNRFDIISTNGVNGAFTAATAADVGSPGVGPNPVPANVFQVPASRTNTVGDTVTFTNTGYSLPPLHFHWFFGASAIDSRTAGVKVGYTNGISTLTLNNVQTTNAGTYTVIAENGLQSFTNRATLAVVSAATASSITAVTPPFDTFDAFLGQTLKLSVTAGGFPTPQYQWQTNNVDLPGETNNQLSVSLSDTNQTAVYSVRVFNTAGSTNATFNVRVIPVPNLVITEVMSGESADNSNGDTSGHQDWFELSNLGNFAVNLHGFRIDDSHQSLAQSAPVTNRTMIQPYESVVLVQNMTADAFRAWWGTNLPATVKIIGFNGAGQGLSGSGDDVHIWNAAATSDGDQVTGVNFLTGTVGVSFGFDPTIPNQTGFYGFAPDGLSTVGVNGAFVATVGGDVGSPGTIVTLPKIVNFGPTNSGMAISWNNQPNWNYTVQYKTNLSDTNWTTLSNVTSDSSSVFGIVDPTVSTQRFYRVGLTP